MPRVLLVDDDARTSRRLAGMLREDGFAVDYAKDGAAAIARLARAPLPDVIVTELALSHADGMAVARFGRAQRPGLPVVVVTGYPNLVSSSSLGDPVLVLLTKPLEYGRLREVLLAAGQARATEPLAATEGSPRGRGRS